MAKPKPPAVANENQTLDVVREPGKSREALIAGAVTRANCQVPCDSLEHRVWRLSAARAAMSQLYQHLGT